VNGSGFAEFDRLTELFVRARDVLERVVREHDLPREASDFLAAAVLPHVELVEAASRAAAEDSLQQRVRPPRVTRPTGNELAAIDHARIVFALLPHLPNQEARWPMRWPHAGYGDVDPPRRPSELAARIEELERHVWWTAAGRPSLDDPAYRRTFGFFDTAAWLGSRIIGGAA